MHLLLFIIIYIYVSLYIYIHIYICICKNKTKISSCISLGPPFQSRGDKAALGSHASFYAASAAAAGLFLSHAVAGIDPVKCLS